jgi:hypothetical protein
MGHVASSVKEGKLGVDVCVSSVPEVSTTAECFDAKGSKLFELLFLSLNKNSGSTDGTSRVLPE